MDRSAVLKAFFCCAKIYIQCHALSSERMVVLWAKT
ncbi:hypothetical protein RUMOBE_01770 [Blautia obeum ATCC 29174]|uniref:Uncharacterized protein n=1 Tax=Blautia obeum ATCC 29174 TaxID=411459 RepID=A5ZRZ2_9FIRM|nr:hypothetical protein RUMOBE_01770 [Blautia obeum ATCC 29174]